MISEFRKYPSVLIEEEEGKTFDDNIRQRNVLAKIRSSEDFEERLPEVIPIHIRMAYYEHRIKLAEKERAQ
jgi:hypothetical protein